MTARPVKPTAITRSHLCARPEPTASQQLTVQVSDGIITITATGHVDRLTAAAFREDLFEVWPVCAGILTVDLSACTYLSNDAVRALQEIWRRPTRAHGELRVIASHPAIADALDAANIPRIRTPQVRP
ncbi:STAS domain-containing protein [Kribbella sp. NPDC056861]|uniref:STAS domain-containing protein n=1 Tax=Kribbella sp. NPDC056861 TaxID=3154857 RepID=UPI003442E708